MSSRTWSAKTAVVTADKELASVIVRLMMAMNDIALANEGLSEWTGMTDRRKVYRQNGGRLYYGRMLMAHIYEALSIIEDIQQDPKLRDTVQLLMEAAQADPTTLPGFEHRTFFCPACHDVERRPRR